MKEIATVAFHVFLYFSSTLTFSLSPLQLHRIIATSKLQGVVETSSDTKRLNQEGDSIFLHGK